MSLAAAARMGTQFRAASFVKASISARRVAPVRAFHVNAAAVGDDVPDVTLYGATPGDAVSLSEATSGKKAVIFGVPGAFTPGCSATHLPGYIGDIDEFKKAGVDEVICVSVNDPFVMAAWGVDQGCEGKVTMLADTQMELTKALDITLDAEAKLGNKRCKRFSMIVDDGKIKDLAIEPDGGGLTISLSGPTLERLASL